MLEVFVGTSCWNDNITQPQKKRSQGNQLKRKAFKTQAKKRSIARTRNLQPKSQVVTLPMCSYLAEMDSEVGFKALAFTVDPEPPWPDLRFTMANKTGTLSRLNHCHTSCEF